MTLISTLQRATTFFCVRKTFEYEKTFASFGLRSFGRELQWQKERESEARTETENAQRTTTAWKEQFTLPNTFFSRFCFRSPRRVFSFARSSATAILSLWTRAHSKTIASEIEWFFDWWLAVALMDESTEHFNLSWTIQATQRARTSSTTSSRKRQEKKVCPWIIRPSSPCKYFCGSLIFRLMLCCIYGKSVMWKFDLLLSRFSKQAAGRYVMNFFFLSFIVVVDNEVWIWLLSTPTRWSLNYSWTADRALIWLESLSARCRGCRAAMGTRCRSTSNRSLLILFFFNDILEFALYTTITRSNFR